MTLALPNSLEAIDAPWVNAALALRYPGTVVAGLRHGKVIRGTATKVQLLLDYAAAGNPHGLPASMWFKAGLEAHSSDEAQRSVYAGEAAFYRDIAGRLQVDCPAAYAAHVDPATGDSMLLLEDLLIDGATFGSPDRPLDVAQAARVMTVLARLHGQFWGGEALREFGWLQGGGPLLRGGIVDLMLSEPVWERALSLPRGRFITGPLRDRERMHRQIVRLLEHDARHAHCLVHADPHLGNLFFRRDGSPAYLDWQTTALGFWAHDVACFVTTSLTIADRRHAERDLLAHYVAQLAEQGIELAMEQAWLEYRRHALWYFTWTMCPPELQPEEFCCINGERATAALLDLGTLDLW